MGGNNFESLVRLPAKEYKELETKVLKALYVAFNEMHNESTLDYVPQFKANTIPYYHQKDSFGDMDILVANWSSRYAYLLLDKLNAAGLISHENGKLVETNGPFTSYPIVSPLGTFQLDIIGGFDYFEQDFARNYFSYNDLGNFVGRYAHKIGLKFGHRGLFYPLHWIDDEGKDHFLGDIQLSTDFKKVVSFLGFDHNRWDSGFDTMEEIYDMVLEHPGFSRSLFDLKEVSHNARVRDKKRKSYSGLLKYIESKGDSILDFRYEAKHRYLDAISEAFPILDVEVQEKVAKFLLDRELKRRWNGKVIMEVSERAGKPISGKDIGEFNKLYKPSALTLLKMTDEQIRTEIYDCVKVEIG